MDSIKGVCSLGKERLLADDYHSLHLHRTRTGKSRCADILYIGVLITAVLACIVSCVCAVYCHKALADIRKTQHDTEQGISAAQVSTTGLPQSARLEYDIDSNWDESGDYDYENVDGIDEIELEESYYDDLDDKEDDLDVDGSGGSSEDNYDDENVRRRRAANPCEARCENKRGKRKTKCLSRCNNKKGGKQRKQKKQTKQSKETEQAINLPAAQFEVKFTDTDIQDKVKKTFNSYANAEDVPLNIFKAASWVDEKTSPVILNNSVAHAKSAGIYLVYAQAYIGGKEPEKSILVVQKSGGMEINALSCRTGVHPDHYDSLSGELQTCSVLGLMNLKIGDTIEIQKSATTANIMLDKDKTYFGLVQLSRVALPKNMKQRN